MKQRIKTSEDLSWLLDHTGRFRGAQVTDLHIQKCRILDEGSRREVTAGTVLTMVIRYELFCTGGQGFYPVTRVTQLTMLGVTDFSIFEQEGSDCSRIGVIHAEARDGRLRFWFDPQGELYVICEEAELEELSMPGPERPGTYGITDWTFQARCGELPGISWFLDHLDQAGLPCAWRAAKRKVSPHPALRWEGNLTLASQQGSSDSGLVHILTYGSLDECGGFGVTLRTRDLEEESGRLLMVLADIIARHFEGTCMAGRHILEGDEWGCWQAFESTQPGGFSQGRNSGLGQRC